MSGWCSGGPGGSSPGPRKVSLVEDDVHLGEELRDGVVDRDRAEVQLGAQLAELLLERAVADDRHRRGVAQAVGDRRLVVLDLLAQRVELGGLEGRLGGGEAAVGAEDLAGLGRVDQEVDERRRRLGVLGLGRDRVQHRRLQVEVLRALLRDRRSDEAELGVALAEVGEVARTEVVPRELARGERGVEGALGDDLLDALLRNADAVADRRAPDSQKASAAPRSP